MPKVGKKHFPYTKKGVQDAKNFSKKTGKKLVYTQKMDDMYDKTHGIKEGSKKDIALDKKRGLKPELKSAKKAVLKGIKKGKTKKLHMIIIAPKKVMKGKTPLPIPVPVPMKPMGKLKNPSMYE